MNFPIILINPIQFFIYQIKLVFVFNFFIEVGREDTIEFALSMSMEFIFFS